MCDLELDAAQLMLGGEYSGGGGAGAERRVLDGRRARTDVLATRSEVPPALTSFLGTEASVMCWVARQAGGEMRVELLQFPKGS